MKKYELRININGDYLYTSEHIPLIINLNQYASGVAALGGTTDNIVVLNSSGVQEPRYITVLDPTSGLFIIRTCTDVIAGEDTQLRVRWSANLSGTNSYDVVKDTGAVNFWRWNENISGFLDLAGNYNLTSSGVTTTTSIFWKAGLYSSGGYATNPSAGSFNGSSPFSLLSLYNPSQVDMVRGIMSKRNVIATEAGFEWYVDENNKMNMIMCSDITTGNMLHIQSNESVATSGEWAMCYFTYPGIGTNLNLIKMGCDGTELTFASGSHASLSGTFIVSDPFYLGTLRNNLSGNFIGLQSVATIYDEEKSNAFFSTNYEMYFNSGFYSITGPVLVGAPEAVGIPSVGHYEHKKTVGEILLDGSILEVNKKYYNRLKEDYKDVDFIKV